MLIESKIIGNEEAEIYRSSKYRVTTIIASGINSVMNVYIFNREELNDYLTCYNKYAEFIVSVEQAEAMA